MKYRIKIVTFKTGRIIYYPQFKKWIGWTGLAWDGTEGYDGKYHSREAALSIIDKHYNGNNSVMSIEFEYINK